MRTAVPWLLPTQPTSTATLLARGVSKAMITTRQNRGDLLRVRHGVYLARSAWPDDPSAQHLIRAYAEIAANPAAVLSHQSAALAWHLPAPGRAWHEQPVSITLPAGCGFSASQVVGVHHVAELPASHLGTDAAGYPVTSLPRTAIDLAADLPLPQALVVLDAASRQLCSGFVTEPRRSDLTNPRLVEAARELLARTAAERRRSSVQAAIALAEPCRESAAESLSAGEFEVAGLPRPAFQVPIRTPMGTLFPDCYWRDANLIGECDGAVKYRDSDAYVREKEREQVFRDLDYRVVRWLAREIMTRPDLVVARVARELGL